MSTLPELIALLGAVFAGSYLMARGLASLKAKPRERLPVEPDSRLKILTASGVYRSHVESVGPGGLVIGSPLYRDSYVPLRVGESVVVQTPQNGTLVTFRTEIIARDSETHELTLALPTRFRRTERRCEPRLKSVEGQAAKINGERASMLDISAWGAKMLTTATLEPGEMVRVDLPVGIGVATGWVLEACPHVTGGRLGKAVRIRFEDPLSGLVTQRGWQARLGTQ